MDLTSDSFRFGRLAGRAEEGGGGRLLNSKGDRGSSINFYSVVNPAVDYSWLPPAQLCSSSSWQCHGQGMES